MAKKHASNEKVKEEAIIVRTKEGEEGKIELRGVFDAIAALEDARQKINNEISAKIAHVKKRWGYPATVSRQITKERRMSPEAYSSHQHHINDARKQIGLQLDLTFVADSRPAAEDDFDDAPGPIAMKGNNIDAIAQHLAIH